METNSNPFKEIEPEGRCPPELKREILSEIDLMRNALQVVEVYAYNIFTVFVAAIDDLMPDKKNQP